MIHPDAHPAPVVGHVIDPIGYGLAKLVVREVVNVDPRRLPLARPLTPAVAERPNQLFLLRINRHNRLAQSPKGPHTPVDAPELCVAVGVLTALQGLAIGLPLL